MMRSPGARASRRVDLLQQGGEIDRLGVELVAARLERLLAIADHGVGGERDDRDVAGGSDRPSAGARTPSRRSPAVPGPAGSGPAHASRAIARPCGPSGAVRTAIAAARQLPRQHVPIHLVVLDDQDHVGHVEPDRASARPRPTLKCGLRPCAGRTPSARRTLQSCAAAGHGFRSPALCRLTAKRRRFDISPMDMQQDTMPTPARRGRLLWARPGRALAGCGRHRPGDPRGLRQRRRCRGAARRPAGPRGSRLGPRHAAPDPGHAGAPALLLHPRQPRPSWPS